MNSEFLTIVITSPDEIKEESEKICRLIDAGVDYVHIRKPEWCVRDVRNLIETIRYPYRNRLKLHGHFGLFNDMTLGGAHVNSRNKKAPFVVKSLSKSCHTLAEVEQCAASYDYVTLSPIFDSISKEGYNSKFNLNEIESKIEGKHVVALGGVTPEHFSTLREKGFFGAALLGYIWNGNFDRALAMLEKAIKQI